MTDIFPFIGTRYNSRLIEDMKTVISPSYEFLSPAERKVVCQRHPYNILNLIPSCSHEEDEEYNDSYLRAASAIQAWRRDGILVNDNHRSFYFYEQVYAHPIQGCKSRKGLYALVNLNRENLPKLFVEGNSPYSNKSHHMKLLRATKCNFSPIPLFFEDPKKEFRETSGEISTSKPWEEFQDYNGDVHRLWVLNKKGLISSVIKTFQDKECFMVEGHERYEVALKFRDEQRDAPGWPDSSNPYDHTLVFLSSFKEGSVSTRPVHRVLSSELGSGVDLEEVLDDLSENFQVRPIKTNIKKTQTATEKILKTIAEKGKKYPAIGMVLPDGRAFVLILKSKTKIPDLYDEDTQISDPIKQLQVSILHSHIIRQVWIGNPEVELEEEDILYLEDPVETLRWVADRKASAAFFLNPCSGKQLNEVLSGGEMIPPFTLRLHPPLMTGPVFRDMSIRH